LLRLAVRVMKKRSLNSCGGTLASFTEYREEWSKIRCRRRSALQNALVRVHQRLDHFDGRSRFSTWLFRVTFNEALMTLRRNRLRRRECCVDICCVDDGPHGVSNIRDLRESNEQST
jgi:hypothetical protein